MNTPQPASSCTPTSVSLFTSPDPPPQPMDGGVAAGLIIFIIVVFVLLTALSIWLFFHYFNKKREGIREQEKYNVSLCDNMTGDAKTMCINNQINNANNQINTADTTEAITGTAFGVASILNNR